MAIANKIIIGLNVITALLGLVMLAGAIYVSVTPQYSAYASATTLWVAGGAGAAVFFVSIFGCVGAGACRKDESKPIMMCYLFFLLIVCAAQIAGAYFIGVYLGALQGQSVGGYTAQDINGAIAAETNNLVLSVYQSCCSGCPSAPSDPSFACSASQQAAMNATSSITSANCGTSCFTTPYCTAAYLENPALNLTNCYYYSSSTTAENMKVPYSVFAPETCNALTQVNINSTTTIKLVGKVTDGSCGTVDKLIGYPVVFQQQAAALLYANATWILGIAGAVAALELLLVFATFAALICDPKQK